MNNESGTPKPSLPNAPPKHSQTECAFGDLTGVQFKIADVAATIDEEVVSRYCLGMVLEEVRQTLLQFG